MADASLAPRERLQSAIYLFFESEAKEYSLRSGLQEADIYFEKMQQYRELESIVTKRLCDFLTEILPSNSPDIALKALLIFTVTTSIASRVTQSKNYCCNIAGLDSKMYRYAMWLPRNLNLIASNRKMRVWRSLLNICFYKNLFKKYILKDAWNRKCLRTKLWYRALWIINLSIIFRRSRNLDRAKL